MTRNSAVCSFPKTPHPYLGTPFKRTTDSIAAMNAGSIHASAFLGHYFLLVEIF